MGHNSVDTVSGKALWYRLIGSVCVAVCALLLATSAAKALYQISVSSSLNALDRIFFGFFGRFVEYAYQSAAEQAPTTAELVWKLAPTWTVDSLYPGNTVLIVYLVLFAGVHLFRRGHEYKKLLLAFRQRMLLLRLEEDVRGVRLPRDRIGSVAPAEPPRLPWHQGATATIVLGIALPLIVQLIQIAVGLAKLP